jgi:2-hydroxycyclohexanecarboxyl-CoA dehydrogenase
LDLDGPGAEQAALDIAHTTGQPTIGIACNVADKESVDHAARTIESNDSLPPVGALAAIAGIASPVSFMEVDLELWRRVIDVNLTGTFLACQAFLPAMLANGYGRIVTMSSVSAQQGGGVFSKTPYSAAKAGILGLTRSLAREVAESGITVNSIAPGAVETDIRVGSTEDDESRLTGSIPMKRQATTDDIASLILWLCSEDASYITGTTQAINGGSYIS